MCGMEKAGCRKMAYRIYNDGYVLVGIKPIPDCQIAHDPCHFTSMDCPLAGSATLNLWGVLPCR